MTVAAGVSVPGTRRTRQRLILEAVIGSSDGPLTVAQIHTAARAVQPRLGLATVYRSLQKLVEGGEVLEVMLPDGQARFEPRNRGHHHHFQCRLCGVARDLPGCPVRLERMQLPHGFVLEGHELTLLGTCPDCIN